MDVKKMRRVRAELLGGLQNFRPASPEDLISRLCEVMSDRSGQPVIYRLMPFPAGTVTGLWIATKEQHLVLVEERTDPMHQLVILGHEFWHLESHRDEIKPMGGAEAARLLSRELDADTIHRIAAQTATRTAVCRDEREEQACELFGAMLGNRAAAWLPVTDPGPGEAPRTTDLVRRLEAALVHRTVRQPHA